MAGDYENMHDIDELDDSELRDLVKEQLREHQGLDIDDITIHAAKGVVTLSGRVGTDGERRVVEHVLTDVLGIQDFQNDLVVDSIRRAESPSAIDEQLSDDESRGGTLLGDVEVPFSAEAEHLADEFQDDFNGTTDYQRVMEDGMTWNPPSSPTPEGVPGGSEELGGKQH